MMMHSEWLQDIHEDPGQRKTHADSVMIFLNGSRQSFHCDCGCNVFHPGTDKWQFICNACALSFHGEE